MDNEPLVLLDGTKIDVSNGCLTDEQLVEATNDEQPIIEVVPIDLGAANPLRNRTVHELPGTIKDVNACALIFVYTCLGVADYEIARILNVKKEDVISIRAIDTYESIREELLSMVHEHIKVSVAGQFVVNANKAAGKVISAIDSGNGDRALKAAADVLDRAGFRPTDRIEHIHKHEDELVVRFIDNTSAPIITIEGAIENG